MRDFLTALALVFFFEGIAYALFPKGMRDMARMMVELPPEQLRIAGLIAATLGAVAAHLIRQGVFF